MAVVARSGTVLLPNVGMSQSSVMVGALLAGFVVYLGLNGKLATYWSILIGGGSTSTAAPATSTGSGSTSTGSTSTGSPVSTGASSQTTPFGTLTPAGSAAAAAAGAGIGHM